MENEEVAVDTTNNEGEVNENENDFVKVSKSEYEKLNQTLGSLKRENKDFKKKFEEVERPKETPKSNQPDDNRLLEKAFLRSAQIMSEDEVELALSTAKKWDMSLDKLVDDEDFKIKLDKLRTQKSNELATSALKERGGTGKSSAKEDSAYWISKGVPPTPNEVADRKVRGKIIKDMLNAKKGVGANPYWNG